MTTAQQKQVNALVKRLWHEGLEFPIVGTVFRLPEPRRMSKCRAFLDKLDIVNVLHPHDHNVLWVHGHPSEIVPCIEPYRRKGDAQLVRHQFRTKKQMLACREKLEQGGFATVAYPKFRTIEAAGVGFMIRDIISQFE